MNEHARWEPFLVAIEDRGTEEAINFAEAINYPPTDRLTEAANVQMFQGSGGTKNMSALCAVTRERPPMLCQLS